jgi:hypothetical protein
LAVAVLLAALNVALPSENVMFMVEGENMPWIPPIVLGVIGIVLLATAGSGTAETAPAGIQDEEKAALNKRLEGIGWGLFLIMLGGFAMVPETQVPKGTWSIGVGVIMLGLNGMRYFNQIKMSGFTTFLGVISLLSGITQLMGLHDLDGPILLIILGSILLIKPWLEKQQLFGKAEEG